MRLVLLRSLSCTFDNDTCLFVYDNMHSSSNLDGMICLEFWNVSCLIGIVMQNEHFYYTIICK